jgi:hypothetical protein
LVFYFLLRPPPLQNQNDDEDDWMRSTPLVLSALLGNE